MQNHEPWGIAGKVFRGKLHNDERLKDAIELISDTLDAADLEYTRAELWFWLKAIYGNTPWSFRGSPSIVIHLEDLFRNMITGSHQILLVAEDEGMDISSENLTPFCAQQIEKDRLYMVHLPLVLEKYKGSIRRLTIEETQLPILFLKRFFSYHSYEEWNDVLTTWVEYALSRTSICDAAAACTEIEEYELLEGLLEIIALIVADLQ